MNLHGINSAALNGGAYNIIAGAALVAISATATATPTQIHSVSAQTTLVVATSAQGLRIAQGAATISTSVTGSATWQLLSLMDATIRAGASGTAAATEAYALAKAAATATGTLVQGAAGNTVISASGTALALVTPSFRAETLVSASCSADPSIKLSGQSVWNREGYANVTIKVATSADALRTAFPNAVAFAGATAQADSIWIHGGSATIICGASGTAMASTDKVEIACTSTATAVAVLTAGGAATTTINATCSATATNTTQGLCDPLVITAGANATGRLAVLASATASIQSDGTADGRLAQLGEAEISVRATTQADGRRILLCEAWTSVIALASADGMRICQGAGAITVSATVSADAETNPTVAAPASRTFAVLTDARVMSLPPEFREINVL